MQKLLFFLCVLCTTTTLIAQAAYVDEFDDGNVTHSTTNDNYAHAEADGIWTITGNANTAMWSAFGFNFPEAQDIGAANNEVYLRVRTTDVLDTFQLRIDVQDTAQLVSNLRAQAQEVTSEWDTLVFNFEGRYLDGGFGGAGSTAGCNQNGAPACSVDSSAINALLFYVNPGVVGFEGSIEVDWLTTGEALGGNPEEVGVYQDRFEDGDELLFTDAAGYTVTQGESVATIAVDESKPNWSAAFYSFPENVNFTGNNKLYLRAKSNTDAAYPLRIDVQDTALLVSNLSGDLIKDIQPGEYQIYEFDFTGRYTDGGWGGPGVDAGCADNMPRGCPVAATHINGLFFLINPGEMAAPGSISIDWLSVGSELEGGVSVRPELLELEDFIAFPNPTHDEVTFRFKLQQSTATVLNLYDAVGRRVLDRSLQGVTGENQLRVSTADLPAGTYHAQLVVGDRPTRAITVFRR